MIKGLRPGPTTQYFARKPPQTLEKLLQKMDEYIRADNDFRQRREEGYRYSEMARGFGGRLHPRHIRTIHNPKANMTGSTTLRAASTTHSLRAWNKLPTGHQPREAEGGEASEEGMVISLGICSIYSTAKTRDTPQGHAKSWSRSRRKSPKPKHGRISRSRSCILLCAILRISHSMWATNSLRPLFLRQVIPKLPGLSCHPHHHWRLP
jgi:hypothetical protein